MCLYKASKKNLLYATASLPHPPKSKISTPLKRGTVHCRERHGGHSLQYKEKRAFAGTLFLTYLILILFLLNELKEFVSCQLAVSGYFVVGDYAEDFSVVARYEHA